MAKNNHNYTGSPPLKCITTTLVASELPSIQHLSATWTFPFEETHWRSTLFKWPHPLHDRHPANDLHSYFPYFSEKIRTSLSFHSKPPTPLHTCPHFYAFPAEFWVPTSLPYSRTLLLQLPHATGITDCPFYPDNSFSVQTRC